ELRAELEKRESLIAQLRSQLSGLGGDSQPHMIDVGDSEGSGARVPEQPLEEASASREPEQPPTVPSVTREPEQPPTVEGTIHETEQPIEEATVREPEQPLIEVNDVRTPPLEEVTPVCQADPVPEIGPLSGARGSQSDTPTDAETIPGDPQEMKFGAHIKNLKENGAKEDWATWDDEMGDALFADGVPPELASQLAATPSVAVDGAAAAADAEISSTDDEEMKAAKRVSRLLAEQPRDDDIDSAVKASQDQQKLDEARRCKMEVEHLTAAIIASKKTVPPEIYADRCPEAAPSGGRGQLASHAGAAGPSGCPPSVPATPQGQSQEAQDDKVDGGLADGDAAGGMQKAPSG
ncbi:unnamed protein product, partial [Prorocentrum cordatum]